MPETIENMPNAKASPPLVVALVYDGLCTFEYGIASEVFGLKRPEFAKELYQFTSVSIGDETLHAQGGLEFKARGVIEDLEKAHTIVIPGWRGKDADVPDSICQQLRLAHKRGTRFLSICSGSYVLAAAGLLSNKRATTHWQYLDHFQSKYPDIHVQDNELYIDDAGIITSAGSSAGLDACLYIVRCDYGVKIANVVARRLVMHSHRHGSHSQIVERPVPQDKESADLAELLQTLRLNLSKNYNVADLAKLSGMSARTFQRRFQAFTGMPVMQWLNQERLNLVCELLESSDMSIDAISESAGFGSAETLRYHFKHAMQTSPSDYRKMLER